MAGVEGHRVGEVEVGVGLTGPGAPANNVVWIRTTEDVGDAAGLVSVVAAVDHSRDIGYEQDAANHVSALTLLQWTVFEMSDVHRLCFLLGHGVV